MPKLKLEFNLPEEQSEANIATGANGMHSAIWNFKQELRNKLKHGDYSDKEYKLLEEMSELLYKELEDNKVLSLFD